MSNVYEVVVKGTLGNELTEAIGFDHARSFDGKTYLVGHNVNQDRLHSVFTILQDLNITLVSVNEL
jgi:hypothetical protein